MTERVFLASFWFAGRRHSTRVPARDWAEAEAKLGAMALGRIDGEWLADVPGGTGGGLIARAICAARNLWRKVG